MNTLKTVLRGILIFIAAVIGAVVVLGFIFPLNQRVPLPGGGWLTIKHASFWASLAGRESLSNCKIIYQPALGKAGTVVFWEYQLDGPDVVFPSSDGHSLLCLYNWDTSEPLLKIDTSRDFKGSDNWIVKAVVLSSPWHVERASLADWEEAEAYLTAKKNYSGYVGGVRSAIDNMRHGSPSIQYGGPQSNSVDPQLTPTPSTAP